MEELRVLTRNSYDAYYQGAGNLFNRDALVQHLQQHTPNHSLALLTDLVKEYEAEIAYEAAYQTWQAFLNHWDNAPGSLSEFLFRSLVSRFIYFSPVNEALYQNEFGLNHQNHVANFVGQFEFSVYGNMNNIHFEILNDTHGWTLPDHNRYFRAIEAYGAARWADNAAYVGGGKTADQVAGHHRRTMVGIINQMINNLPRIPLNQPAEPIAIQFENNFPALGLNFEVVAETNGGWSQAEHNQYLRGIQVYGAANWTAIAGLVGGGKGGSAVSDHHRRTMVRIANQMVNTLPRHELP